MSSIKNDTINEYTNTGATSYSITFEYDKPEQVQVRTYDSTTNEYVDVTDWEFDGATAIRFTGVVPDTFEIFRVTDISQSYGVSRYAVFQQGSAIKAGDLNGNLELLRQAIEGEANEGDGRQTKIDAINDRLDQEVIDRGNGDQNLQDQIDGLDAIYVNVTGDSMTGPLSMSDNLIRDVNNPILGKDAVNLETLQSKIDGLPIGNLGAPPYNRETIDVISAGTNFTIDVDKITIGKENIFLNGTLLGTDDYTITGNTLQLVAPASPGDVIEIISYNYIISLDNNTDLPANAITYTYPGGSQQTGQSRLEQYVSVEDFGAVGDEVTDDTTSIQAAFDHAAQTGKAVYFPAGKYLVSQIKVNTAVSFFGEGRANTRIRSSDNTLNLFTYEIGYSDISPFFMRDLTLYGGKYQLITQNARDVDIRNCSFFRPTEAGIRGGWNAFHWTVEGCEFRGGRYNIMFYGTGTTDTIDENPPASATGISGQLNSLIGNWYVEAEQAAIRLHTAEGLNIIGGYLELCATDGPGGKNSAWAASTAFDVGDVANIKSGTANGYVYRCTSAGTTGTAVPTNSTEGASVVDGTVTWEVLGKRAGVLVTSNRGFRMTHMQGERNEGTPWVILNGTSTYYYATIIANNSIRQTYPAPGIEINNENRVIITGNHFIDNGAWLSIPSGSTVDGLTATGNIYQNEKSVQGTLGTHTLSDNIKQTNTDDFLATSNYTEAYNQAVDRFIEAQYMGNPNTPEQKTYTLAATFDATTKGYVGTYEVQVGQYVQVASAYGLSTYELNVTKGPNGITTDFTKISGNLNVTLTATTNTTTQYTGQIQVGAGEGVLIRVIRKTPLTNRASLTTLTHTIT